MLKEEEKAPVKKAGSGTFNHGESYVFSSGTGYRAIGFWQLWFRQISGILVCLTILG